VFLKRYALSLAAAFAFSLGVAGGALAGSHHRGGHSLVPGSAPHTRGWLRAVREFPSNPTPLHKAKPAHKPKPAHKVRHAHRHRQAAKTQPRPRHRLRATTLSIYEHTAHTWILRAQGCSAGRRHEAGVVVLDFGKPAFQRGGYGTILFNGRFATNHRITAATLAYARGYASCLPRASTAFIALARGTSNYHPALPSAYEAGVRWAHETNKLGRELARHGLDIHVEAAAADDAEPAWDRSFRKTRHFFHGFRAAVHAHTLYDYGSLDGGVGAIWSARQAWYVAGGLRHTKALPEIYNSAMAREWAELARIASGRYHRGVQFAGVMTQGTSSCNCGLRPSAAHRVLARALVSEGVGHFVLPVGGTNIR
jgi:hypothetical protein